MSRSKRSCGWYYMQHLLSLIGYNASKDAFDDVILRGKVFIVLSQAWGRLCLTLPLRLGAGCSALTQKASWVRVEQPVTLSIQALLRSSKIFNRESQWLRNSSKLNSWRLALLWAKITEVLLVLNWTGCFAGICVAEGSGTIYFTFETKLWKLYLVRWRHQKHPLTLSSHQHLATKCIEQFSPMCLNVVVQDAYSQLLIL